MAETLRSVILEVGSAGPEDMCAMRDDDLEPRLAPSGSRRSEPTYLGQVVKATSRSGIAAKRASGRFDGSRIGRGASLGRVLGTRNGHAGARARRVVVKTRLAMLRGTGPQAARAHLRYLQRDGVTRDGESGHLYAADSDTADGKAFLERSDGDRHQFRFIVSAEDGDRYDDLKPFTRRLMAQMEEDLGTRLDWVAVDHFNTGHPHTHILLRGTDDRGENLIIAREYICRGLRERAQAIMTLDLGPKTDLEIEARLRSEVTSERLTSIDRRLLREMDEERVVTAYDRDPLQQALRAGRLQKLGRMGLADELGRNRWRLAEGMEKTLRTISERGDIIRTMQRALTARKLERAAADQLIFDPAAGDAKALVGRVAVRGLSDELHDRHYLILDGVDGRTHYVDVGRPERDSGTDPLREGTIVRVTPRTVNIRTVDQTIVEVAAAHGGRYSADAHMLHDPTAGDEFVQTHVRRLEAMRKLMGSVEQTPDGSWTITADHLDKVRAFEAHQLKNRPVEGEMVSISPLERLAATDAATWLDRELTAKTPTPVRDAGFGREVRQALTARRQWLIEQGLAETLGGTTTYQPDMIKTLQRRELMRVAASLSAELGLPFVETSSGERIGGRLLRRVDLVSGSQAAIERAQGFTLVPWRPVLDRHIGKPVTGILRDSGISWTIGRGRGERGPGG